VEKGTDCLIFSGVGKERNKPSGNASGRAGLSSSAAEEQPVSEPQDFRLWLWFLSQQPEALECSPPQTTDFPPQLPHDVLVESQQEQTCAITATEKPRTHTIRQVAAQNRTGPLIFFVRPTLILSDEYIRPSARERFAIFAQNLDPIGQFPALATKKEQTLKC